MSNQTSKTKNTTTKSKENKKNTNSTGKKGSYIPLPGGRKIPMNVTRWIMFITLAIILIIVLISMPKRIIRNNIMSATSRDEITTYCEKKNLACYFTTLSDYDIEGYHVARVSFLADDFFDDEGADDQTGSSSEKQTKRNVYITVQKGKKIKAAN